MAPAVSWKSSSCCRNRMACRREVKVSIASAYSSNTAPLAVPKETSGCWVWSAERETINPQRSAWAYIAGQFVDGSILGHVVLFIRIILSLKEREISKYLLTEWSVVTGIKMWASCLDAVCKLLQSFGSDRLHGGDECRQLVLGARCRSLHTKRLFICFLYSHKRSTPCM